MKTSQLRAFVAVVEHGSFSAAARVLGVSQPSMTMQMQSLESELGTLVLDRRHRKIGLTEAGEALLPHARRILEQLEDARAAIEGLSGEITGRLVIAASSTPGTYVVPRLLGSFAAAHPRVRLEVAVSDTSQVVAAVHSGEAHYGIAGAVPRGYRVNASAVFTDELVAIAPPDSPLAARRGLSLADLVTAPWVMREVGSGTRQLTEGLLSGAGLDPAPLTVTVELGAPEAVVRAVEGGMGISIVSKLVAADAVRLGSVRELAVRGLPFARPLLEVLPSGAPSRAALAFAAHVRDSLDKTLG